MLGFGLAELWVASQAAPPTSSILHYSLRETVVQLCCQQRFINLIIFLSICLEMRSSSLKSAELLRLKIPSQEEGSLAPGLRSR